MLVRSLLFSVLVDLVLHPVETIHDLDPQGLHINSELISDLIEPISTYERIAAVELDLHSFLAHSRDRLAEVPRDAILAILDLNAGEVDRSAKGEIKSR